MSLRAALYATKSVVGDWDLPGWVKSIVGAFPLLIYIFIILGWPLLLIPFSGPLSVCVSIINLAIYVTYINSWIDYYEQYKDGK